MTRATLRPSAGLAAGLCALLLLSAPAAARPLTEADYQAVNDALVEHHVVPRYRSLAEAMAALEGATGSYCAQPASASLEPVREAFGSALDAWMGVQHLRFGPVELFMRSYRLYFWPEGRGRIRQAVAELLATSDAALLEPERFRNASTAIQGLPAVEVLLYEPPGEAEGGVAYRCALLTRITAGMSAMAEGIVADWQGGEVDFAGVVASPGPDNPYFGTARDATLAFFESLHNGLQLIADIKLKPVVGESAAAARPQLAETSASDRALRNIVLNLEALQGLYLGEGGTRLGALAAEHASDPDLDPLMRKAFRLTLENARGIALPLPQAVTDPAARPAVEKLLTQVLALKQIVRTRLAAALDLAIGFNAMDGD